MQTPLVCWSWSRKPTLFVSDQRDRPRRPTSLSRAFAREINTLAVCSFSSPSVPSFVCSASGGGGLGAAQIWIWDMGPKTKIALFPTQPPTPRGREIRRIVRIFANCRPRDGREKWPFLSLLPCTGR